MSFVGVAGRRGLIALAAALGIGIGVAVGIAPGSAATTPAPVSSHPMPDPGVTLINNTFYGFNTGSGLQESSAPEAAGPWDAPRNVLNTKSVPSWVDLGPGVWAPNMIETTSGTYVVYFASALPGTAGNPTGNDAKPASGARCIAAATASSPTGPFTIQPNPVVCTIDHASDTMAADPGNRVRGEGVIDPSAAFVTIGGQKELFLVYKTQAPTGYSTIRMVRLVDANGTTVLGDSHQLIRSTSPTFAATVEAPSLVQNGSHFILFTSHDDFANCTYDTEWFQTTSIWAWNSNAGTALLTTANSLVCGPGGATVTGSEVAGQYRMFLHGWAVNGTLKPATNAQAGTGSTNRYMYAAVLTFASNGYTPHASFLAP